MEKDLATLKATITTTLSLISQLQSASKAPSTTAKPETVKDSVVELQDSTANLSLDPKTRASSPVNALDLAHDAASLIKAHSTKLSLLMINEPFTPTAICTVLRELAAGPLPGLATALELCDEERYTRLLKKELTFSVENAFRKLAILLEEIPLNGKALKRGQKGSLASTGVVWEACDALIGLKKMGIAGLVVKKAEHYRDTLKDALEELKEWGEEEPDDDEDEDEEDLEHNTGDDAQDEIDRMFANTQHIPRDDPNKIRERLELSLKRLKLVLIMYSAVIKRRFKALPPLPRLDAITTDGTLITQTLDEVMEVLRKIPNNVDELAGAFYELDGKEIDRRMDDCFFLGWSAVELLVKNWQGEKDEFSDWVSGSCSVYPPFAFSCVSKSWVSMSVLDQAA